MLIASCFKKFFVMIKTRIPDYGICVLVAGLSVVPSSLTTSAENSFTPRKIVEDIFVSCGDNWFMGTSLPIASKSSIEDTFQFFKDLGIRRVYWRGDDKDSQIETFNARPENCRYFSMFTWLRHLYKTVDPDRIAVEAARRLGLEIWEVNYLNDCGAPADVPVFADWPHFGQSLIAIEHPEWIPADRYGVIKQGGPIELAYPEARKALVDRYKKLMLRDRYDGLLFLTYSENYSMRFQDEFGFSAPIVIEFKKRTGVDLRTQGWTRFGGRADWIRLRGEYLTAYLRTLKTELAKNNQKLGLVLDPRDIRFPQSWNVPETMRTTGSMYLDLETWVREGIVDHLSIYGNCAPDLQSQALRDVLWLSRQTPVEVEVLTSSPGAVRWETFIQAGVPIMNACAEEAMILNRSRIPEQKLSALTSGKPILRMRALAQIAEGKLHATVADITPLLSDKNVITRRLAIIALAATKDPSAVLLLEKMLSDPEVDVQCIAMITLGKLQRPESIPVILAALAKDDYQNHMLMECARSALLKPYAKPLLLNALKSSKNTAVRTMAARVLVFQAGDGDVSTLVEALKDPERYVRFASAEALGNIKNSPGAVKALIEATRHEDPVVSDRAATSLAVTLARCDAAVMSLRPQILEALKTLYAKLGDNCLRVDADWGYRPVGNALLACGPEGENVLRDFMNQSRDIKLAEFAWKTLYIRQYPNSFNEVTEKENAEAMRMRPKSLKKIEGVRMKNDFDDTSSYSPDLTGMQGSSDQTAGRWGLFSPGLTVISSAAAHSGRNSLKLISGKAQICATMSAGIGGNDHQLSLWMLRETAKSSMVISFKGNQTEQAVQINHEGKVFLKNIKSDVWTDSGLAIPFGKWTQLRIFTKRSIGKYSCAVMVAGREEQLAKAEGEIDLQPNVRTVDFSMQRSNVAEDAIYIDDIKWVELP
jgi:HEAT repeat protein